MDPMTLVVVAGCVLAFALASHRIERSPFTSPMLFAGIGLVAGPFGLGVLALDIDGATTHVIIEATLVLVLYSDASRIRLRELRRGFGLPLRLLAVGLPLTMLLGLLVGRPLFPSLSWAELALLGAILAPTDAALGQVVVNSARVPVRIRQALNVESGLNDGIAVPVVMVCVAAAAVLSDVSVASGAAGGAAGGLAEGTDSRLAFAAAQIGLGPVAGLLVALPGGWLVQRVSRAGGIGRRAEHLAGVAIAVGAYGTAELIGGNGFIAAFIAGLVVGNAAQSVCEGLQEFAEDEGQLLSMMAFLVFGAVMLPPAVDALDGSTVLYVAASLTVVRMLPVALSLVGTGLRWPTVGFLGWFGPRGLATILFALMVAEADAIPQNQRLFHVAALTVAASILAHGATAAPLVAAYGRWIERLRADAPDAPECHDAPELRVRVRPYEQRRSAPHSRRR